MRYLLLGGSGFIGSYLANSLARENQVVVVGRQPKCDFGSKNIEYRQMDFVKCDDFTDYIKDVDIIVHMISTIIPSEDTSKFNLEINENVLPTIRLLEDASRLKKKVIFISSGGAIYGENDNKNKESSPTNPICNYGIIKLMIEKYLALYHEYYGLEYRIIRPSNPYSETVYHNKKQGIIPVIVENLIKGEPMSIYGGEQIRDYIYIDDLVDGISAVLEYTGEQRIFNIGTGEGCSVEAIIKMAEKKTGRKLKVKLLPMRKCDVVKNILDISLIKEETGWAPKISLESGLDKIIEREIAYV